MSSWRRTWSCFLIVAFAASFSARAAEEKAVDASAAAGAPQASAEEIALLVKQLGSDKFAERQRASEKLGKIGKPAIEALVKAATGDSLEVTVRSIDLLGKMLESSDEGTRDSAKGALEKVAKSDRPTAAPRARDALKAIKDKQNQSRRVLPGRIQIAAVAGGGGRRVSVRTVNGVKTIEAQEGDRKVKIVDDPKQGIKMEVTSKKNGKETTEKYEAKDAAELKKKHPKAYEIYTKYAKQGGNIVVQMQAVGGNVQMVARPRPNTIDTAARILPAWTSHLNRLVSEEAVKQASKKSNENLKNKVAEAKKQLDEIEKRLQAAIERSEKKAEKDDQKPEAKDKGPAKQEQK